MARSDNCIKLSVIPQKILTWNSLEKNMTHEQKILWNAASIWMIVDGKSCDISHSCGYVLDEEDKLLSTILTSLLS